MSELKTLDGNSEAFRAGYMVGIAAALDSIRVQHDEHRTRYTAHEALALAVDRLDMWLYGDDQPSEIKTDVLDELPIIVLNKAAEAEIKLPPGVDRLPGVSYSGNGVTDEMADNRDAFLNQTDEGDDTWRSRMHPSTRIDG